MKIPDIESLLGRVEDFFAEVRSNERTAQYRKGRAKTLRAEVDRAITSLGQLLEDLRYLGQDLDRTVQKANKSIGTSLPITALT